MRIIDQSGSAPIVFFNMMINKISGYTTWELMEKHDMDVDEYWRGELLDLVGKRCDAVNDDPAFVKHFKEGFLDGETPTSGNEASRLGESSGSKRLFIDLDDVDSEEDEEGRANKTPKLVTVKVEKEYS
ncbi:hypothetical protein Tco_1248761 [Tanacetum coccineum]